MTGCCKHFAERPESGVQEFELVAKNSKYTSQSICCSCREVILEKETKQIKILGRQEETLRRCTESSSEPIIFPADYPVKDGSTCLKIPQAKPNVFSDTALKDLEQQSGTLSHVNLVLEAKIKAQTMLSNDLEALSLFTIQRTGEGALINGLNALRIDKKTSSLEISAALGQCCLALTCLMNAYNFNLSDVSLLPAGPYSRISVSTKVYPLYIPSSKHPTQLEDFDLGLLELFRLVEAFSSKIRMRSSNLLDKESKFEMKHRDQKICAILEKLDEILKMD